MKLAVIFALSAVACSPQTNNVDGGGSDGSVSDAGADVPTLGDASCDGPCNAVPSGLLDPDYTTTWNPGILSDTATNAPLGNDGLPVRTTVCATVPAQTGDATAAIQNALDGCKGKNQVVMLAAGNYSVSSPITIPSGVVLRGVGSDGASVSAIVSTNGGPVVQIGTMQDTICYDASGFDAAAKPLLASDALKETATLQVASATGFVAGDLALVDQQDTSEVSEGDCTTIFKRVANYGVSERVEIASVSGTTLTLTTPLHWTFKTAQAAHVSRVAQPATKWAGLEDILVQGGKPGGYPGQNAGAIDVSNAAYSWVKNVQVDGTSCRLFADSSRASGSSPSLANADARYSSPPTPVMPTRSLKHRNEARSRRTHTEAQALVTRTAACSWATS